MNLNSQSLFYPPQPDNPNDNDRNFLSQYALGERGRAVDFDFVKRIMSPPAQITNYAKPGEFKNVKVAVIGGGLAGLATAFELRKIGFDITIYEALENRVGGRVYTYYFDDQEKLHHEFGPMRIPVTHETVWHYLNLFKLPTRPFIQYNENSFIYYRKARARNDRNGFNVMKNIYPRYDLKENERNTNWQRLQEIALDSHLLFASPEVRAETIQVKPYYNERTLMWSDNSSMRLMESTGLSQEAISLVSNFFPLLYGNLYNSYIDFIEESYPADLAYLYEIPGGMVNLPKAFIKSFNDPDTTKNYPDIDKADLGQIKYKAGYWVKDIGFDNLSQKVILNYEDIKAKENLKEEFDYVVCAIPFSSLRNINIDPLFSHLKMRAIREVHYTSSQRTLLLCKERFWEKQGIVGGGSYTDLPIASVWYPSDHAKYISSSKSIGKQLNNLPSNEPGVLLGSYNFGLDAIRLSNLPEEKLFIELKRELEMVHGLPVGYLDNIIQEHKTIDWDKEPSFRGALTFFEPEQKRLFSYSMTLPEYNNRVFFAGEHISAVHRWMQGALKSGMEAANDLTISCKMHG
ncbi:FAD-dependent oxidoreductase [Clostridium sp. YIM B02505]|uniref:FAD-dependent oxidoreductase n=1 Tax=Clostridium yunnanense TaxID=2800325 RepID=A0ABS1ETR3_9CLOT|nr:FAD-dependent oxidoreductase [Clostridium yunnanense]MBK1812766.1 FAD-dependent oxidoreductase [Clostridium yunnanense]